MAQQKENVYRLSPDIAGILSDLAVNKNTSEVMVLENLIRKEAITTGIIGGDHPEKAYGDLTTVVEEWALPSHADFTLHVFDRIDSTIDVRRLWEKAVTPLPGQQADKRKHSVNQRLGRFCKRLCGWESAEEIQLGKGSTELIQSYTRLKPPTTPSSHSGTAEASEAPRAESSAAAV